MGGNNWARRLCPEELIFRAALTAVRVQRSRARRRCGLDAAMDGGGGQRLWTGDAVIGAASSDGAKDECWLLQNAPSVDSAGKAR